MKKSIYYIIILLVTIFPYSVNAGWCGDVGTGASCFSFAGTTVYCVTTTWEPCEPTNFSYLTGGAWYDALEKMGGVNPGNINALRANWQYFNAMLAEGNIETSDSSNCSNSNINTTVELTEIPYDENDKNTIISSKEDYKFVRRFNLSVSATSDDGDLNDFTFALNVSINGNKSFKLNGDFSNVDISSQISSGGTYTNVLTVYSKDLIVDASSFTLTAKVTPKTTCSKYILATSECYNAATQRPGQWYIGQISNQTSNIKPESDSVTVPVSNSCQYTIEKDEEGNETPVYRLQIVRPDEDNSEDQIVDVLTYMKKGCCSTVQPKFFNKNTDDGKEALKYYIDNCLDKDVVSYENSCGASDCSGEQNVKSYSYSFVWQASINKLKKEYNLDKLNASDINSEYNGGVFKHYYNESLSNKYCKVLTSERNDIYFPTTAVATSGRFFVFQGLDPNECKELVGSTTCFRQPRVEGVIDLYVKTDLEAYNNDIATVNRKIESTCNNNNDYEQIGDCTTAKDELQEIINARSDCINNIKNFVYDLNPSITFSYEQEYFDGSGKKKSVETVNMVSNDKEVKYWPYITTQTEGDEKNKTYQFDNKYEATYKKIVYYRPEIYTYSLLPSGLVATTNEFQGTTTRFEKGVSIGYVYNIKTTTYVGIYNTWFDISNFGNGGEKSLLNQQTIKEYKSASKRDYNNDESIMFKSQCKYCIEEGAFQRKCDVCNELDPKFVFRNVSLSNITPNTEEGERKNAGTNWVDDKGNTAKSYIKNASGKGIAVADIKDSDKELLNNNNKNAAIKTLESNEKTNIVFTADEGNTNYIYANDEEYLEYDITLTSEDMALIKNNNKDISYDYAKIHVCGELDTTEASKKDLEYCYTCNQDGKECESTFINAFIGNDDNKAPGRSKWKYYFYNPDTKKSIFIKGKMQGISEFENGRYPDPVNQQGWLNTYKNWP